MNQKVLTPDVIQAMPLPGDDMEIQYPRRTSKDVLRPDEISYNGLPVRKIAHEVAGSGFNTITRKIKNRYAFTPTGRINDRTNQGIADARGVLSSTQFLTDQIIFNGDLDVVGDAYGLVAGSTLASFTLERATRILVQVQVQGRANNYVVDSSRLFISADDTVHGNIISFDMASLHRLSGIAQDAGQVITGWSYSLSDMFMSVSNIYEFSAGTHTLRLLAKRQGTGSARIGLYTLGYIMLGT